MRGSRRQSPAIVQLLTFGGWAGGLVWLLNPDDPSFSVLGAVAAVMLVAAGAVAASDDGRAITHLNEPYGLRAKPPSHRFMRRLRRMLTPRSKRACSGRA